MLSFSTLCLPTSFFPVPLVTVVSLQRQQLVPLAAEYVAGQTCHSPPPPTTSSARRTGTLPNWQLPSPQWLPLQLPAPQSQSLLYYFLCGLIHSLLIVQTNGSLRCPGVMYRGHFFSYGCLISCKSKESAKSNDSHCHDSNIIYQLCIILKQNKCPLFLKKVSFQNIH